MRRKSTTRRAQPWSGWLVLAELVGDALGAVGRVGDHPLTLPVLLEPDEEVEAGLGAAAEGIELTLRVAKGKLRHDVDAEAGACVRGGGLWTLLPLVHAANRDLPDTVEGAVSDGTHGDLLRFLVVRTGSAHTAGAKDDDEREQDEERHVAAIGVRADGPEACEGAARSEAGAARVLRLRLP
jgi:hypothetical protein